MGCFCASANGRNPQAGRKVVNERVGRSRRDQLRRGLGGVSHSASKKRKGTCTHLAKSGYSARSKQGAQGHVHAPSEKRLISKEQTGREVVNVRAGRSRRDILRRGLGGDNYFSRMKWSFSPIHGLPTLFVQNLFSEHALHGSFTLFLTIL